MLDAILTSPFFGLALSAAAPRGGPEKHKGKKKASRSGWPFPRPVAAGGLGGITHLIL